MSAYDDYDRQRLDVALHGFSPTGALDWQGTYQPGEHTPPEEVKPTMTPSTPGAFAIYFLNPPSSRIELLEGDPFRRRILSFNVHVQHGASCIAVASSVASQLLAHLAEQRTDDLYAMDHYDMGGVVALGDWNAVPIGFPIDFQGSPS